MHKKEQVTHLKLSEIRQIVYSLYQARVITKKMYNNIINSIKLSNRMDTIFLNSGNIKPSDLQRPLLHLSDKINLKISDKYVTLSDFSIYYTCKYMRKVIQK